MPYSRIGKLDKFNLSYNYNVLIYIYLHTYLNIYILYCVKMCFREVFNTKTWFYLNDDILNHMDHGSEYFMRVLKSYTFTYTTTLNS